MKWYNSSEVAKILGISKATATGLCHDGLLEAVNIARRGSTRCRWRISEKALEKFARDRGNPVPDDPGKKGGKKIQRPSKDYFADAGAK